MVEVTGAVTGRYELLEQAEDGTTLLGPATSDEAITPAEQPARDPGRVRGCVGDVPTDHA